MNTESKTMQQASFLPDELGFYGDFGGAFIPELLRPCVEELSEAFDTYCSSEKFENEFVDLLKNYTGRPTPLYFSKNYRRNTEERSFLSEKIYVTLVHIKSTMRLDKFYLQRKWVKRKSSQKLELDNTELHARLSVP